MDNIWKVETKADNCPVKLWDGNLTIEMKDTEINVELYELMTGQNQGRAHEILSADTVYLAYIAHTDTTYKLGDRYGDSALVYTEIIYKPRKWWQKLMFWEKKEIVGYIFKVVE